MKIGIDIRTLMDNNYSGVSLYTLNLVKEILKQDKENQYILYYNSGKNIDSKLPNLGDNVRVVKTKYPNKVFNYILQNIFKYPKIDKLIAKDLEKWRDENIITKNIDIFFSPHFNFTALSNDCTKVLTIHDLSFLKYPHFFSTRKNIWHRLLNIKKIIKNTDKIIAISGNTKKDIVNLCNVNQEHIDVIPSGISDNYKIISNQDKLSEIKKKYSLPEKFILHIGTIEPRKNIEGIIEAFNKLTLDEYELVLAGGLGWKNEKIFKAYNNSKKKNKIRFLGYIDENDKSSLYNLASLFIFPSFYEGFGFPPLEAQKCGTPVIAGNISSLPEILNESALLVDPDSISSITTAMKEILMDDNLRKRLVDRGLKNVEQFNWQKTANKYIELFNSLSKKNV